MGHIDRILTVESRARRLNLALRTLCAGLGLRHQYLSRWKSGEVEPTIRVFEHTIRSIEEELDRRERELLGYLLTRWQPTDAIVQNETEEAA